MSRNTAITVSVATAVVDVMNIYIYTAGDSVEVNDKSCHCRDRITVLPDDLQRKDGNDHCTYVLQRPR